MTDTSVAIIAAKLPKKVDLEAGKEYYWCRCGRSATQPFCDGSHAGTGITPLKFTAEKSGDVTLCQCKSSANAPFCDGTHARLGDLVAGDPAPTPKSKVPAAVPTPEEPTVVRIHELARDGLSKLGHHGEMGAMGVPRKDLPHWDDIQILPAQLARKPLLDDVSVATSVTIGPRANKPLQLDIPLFVSDMSFGALSEEAKTALARGAEMAGTGICSGEGGMLAEEQAKNSRYFYELASARFGWKPELVEQVQAFHFKGGQGAKTGREVTLLITGGLRVAEDFSKAMAMGADGVALSNSAMQAVGCIAARMCNSNNCPVGIATWKREMADLSGVRFAGLKQKV